jgi:aubergine-like protein
MTGRGRGTFFQKINQSPPQAESTFDDLSSEATTTDLTPIVLGRGRSSAFLLPQRQNVIAGSETVGRGRTLGRGLFSVMPTITNLPSQSSMLEGDESCISYDPSDKRFEECSSSPKKSNDMIQPSSSGRGRSYQVIGTASGGSAGKSISDGHSNLIQKVQGMSIESKESGHGSSFQQTEVPSKEIEPVIKHGKNGTPMNVVTNSIEIKCDPNKGVFEYEVRTKPEIDHIPQRRKLLLQLADELGKIKTFDGVTLYLPFELEELPLIRTLTNDKNEPVEVKITLRRKKRLADCIHMYNVLFERVMKLLNYERINRKFFDLTAPKSIPAQKLEVFPGYVKAIDEHEGGLFLTLDVSHRVISKRSCLEYMREVVQKRPQDWKDMVKKGLTGSIVMTSYNKKSYRVDDIDFGETPMSTFEYRDGRKQTYKDYYKENYGITIQDLKQPLLINRQKIRIAGQREKFEQMCCLVPELCNLTGLTDELRSNFSVMKELANYTKVSPHQRVAAYRKFLENVNNNSNVMELLNGWGLQIEKEPTKVVARILDEETVVFGREQEFKIDPKKADFTRHATTCQVIDPIDLHNWVLIYPRNDKKAAESLENNLMKCGGPSGIRVSAARRIEISNDSVLEYTKAIRESAKDRNIQIMVTIFSSLRMDRYAAVKKLLCADLPFPSQCLLR